MSVDLTQTTKRHIQPYKYQRLMNGKICICKTNGQMLIVSRDEVQHILRRDDLDPHRRNMYEAALAEWENEEKTQ